MTSTFNEELHQILYADSNKQSDRVAATKSHSFAHKQYCYMYTSSSLTSSQGVFSTFM